MALARGMPIPDAIKNAPSIPEGMEVFLVAFIELSTCRSITMGGLGPIPWTAINEYAAASGMIGDLRDSLFYYVRALQNAEYERKREKDKPKLILP